MITTSRSRRQRSRRSAGPPGPEKAERREKSSAGGPGRRWMLLIGDMGRKGSLRDRDELQVVDDLIGQKKLLSHPSAPNREKGRNPRNTSCPVSLYELCSKGTTRGSKPAAEIKQGPGASDSGPRINAGERRPPPRSAYSPTGVNRGYRSARSRQGRMA